MAERRLLVRTATLALDGDYEGWQATMRVNPSIATFEELASNDVTRVKAAMASVLVSWNFADEEGREVPATVEGIGAIPIDLLGKLLTKWQEAVVSPPLARSSS